MGIHLRGRHSGIEQTTANTNRTDNVKNQHKTHFSEKLSSVTMSVKKFFRPEPKISAPLVTIPEKSYSKSVSSLTEKHGPDSPYVADVKSKKNVTDAVNINHLDTLFESTVAAYREGRSPMRETTGAATDERCMNELLNIKNGGNPVSDLSANIILKTVRSERMPHITESIKTLSMDQRSFNKHMDDKIGRLSPENQALTNAIFGKLGSEMVVKDEIGQPSNGTSIKMADFMSIVCMQGIIDVGQLVEDVRSLDQTQVNIVVASIKEELHDEENDMGGASQWIGKSIAHKLASYMLTKVPEDHWQTED